MITRQRYRIICNNLLQAIKNLAHDENDYNDFLIEQGISKEEVKEIERLETPIISLISPSYSEFEEADPFETKMNTPIVNK